MKVPLRPLAVTVTAVFVSACWPCPTCPPGPTRVVIDFEHYPGPDGKLGTSDDVAPPTSWINPSNQWASVGVVFTKGTIVYNPQGLGAQAGFGAYYLSSLPVEGNFSVPVFGIEITSYSMWNAKLTAYDASNRVLALANLWAPGGVFYRGTLRLRTSEPIAKFAVIEQSENANLMLNLDYLVLTTSPP